MIRPIIEDLGYEFVGVEFNPHKDAATLRIYIDKADGIHVDDCGKVSHEVSAILDVEDPIPGNYYLEVSSPGVDRPIFFTEDFERFAGQMVKLKLNQPVEKARKYQGNIQGVSESALILNVEDQEIAIPFDVISKANLIGEI